MIKRQPRRLPFRFLIQKRCDAMSRKITLNLSYKEMCILKHALRDKLNRNADEESMYQKLYKVVAARKELWGIDNQTDINHEPVIHTSRNKILR